MKNIFKSLAGSLTFLIISSSFLYAGAIFLKTFPFDYPDALKSWERMILNREVDYILMNLGDDGFVRAKSDKACSALYHKLKLDLAEYSILRWKWKVTRFPDLSGARTDKEKDDYAARIYVMFPRFSFAHSQFLEYVWSDHIPVGTIMDSPYGKNIKIIVLRRGIEGEGAWVNETRNIYEDYILAFGKKPAKPVGAIAIMCDADSTETVAESYFDAIEISQIEEP